MCSLPIQEGPTCGACAVAYYLYFQSGKTNSKILEDIGNIYTEVKFDAGEGSDPQKIQTYLNSKKLYVPNDVCPALEKAMNLFIPAGSPTYSDPIECIGPEFAITLWCPTNWDERTLSNMHYMLAQTAAGKLMVLDSNKPNNAAGQPTWQTVKELYNFTPDGSGTSLFFTGLIIK